MVEQALADAEADLDRRAASTAASSVSGVAAPATTVAEAAMVGHSGDSMRGIHSGRAAALPPSAKKHRAAKISDS
jgi:hypothetical protein